MGTYAGGKSRTHKSWFNNGSVSAMTSKAVGNEEGSTGSAEDMVPMGRIQVRHDVDWHERERSEEEGGLTPEVV